MNKPIVVVGSINLDLVVRTAHIPLAGETVSGDGFQTFSGGKGANQAVAAARLGSPVALIGRLGNDRFASQLRQGLNQAKIDTTAVAEVAGPSGAALISTDERGENSIIVVAGANSQVTPDLIDRHIDKIRNAAIVLTQLEIPLETVQHLADIARDNRVPLALDPAPARSLPDSLLQELAWLTPNETETSTLIGKGLSNLSDVKEATDLLRNRGVRNVILKLGGRGCYLALQDGRPHPYSGLQREGS